MAPLLQRTLFGIVVAIIGTDVVWASIRHFDIDLAGYFELACVSLALLAGGLYYDRARKDYDLGAMLFGTSFLVAFSASFALLNYFLMTIAGKRIDDLMAAIDHAMGIDWPTLMQIAAAHPGFNAVLHVAYQSVLPQVAVLIAVLGCCQKRDLIGPFCLALAIGAMITVFFWTAFPALGALTYYQLPPETAARLSLALDGKYGRDLLSLFENGPGRISPHDMKGLIGFPSFHLVMSILIVWYARSLKAIRVPALLLNVVVLISTPIQGGHHVVDLIGGFMVAALAIPCADWVGRIAARGDRAAAWGSASVALPAAEPPLADAACGFEPSEHAL